MEKTEGEILKEKLFNEKKVGWETTTEEEKEKIFKFADEYMYFMNHSKTEREIVKSVIDILEKNNFKRISEKSAQQRPTTSPAIFRARLRSFLETASHRGKTRG